MQKIIMKIPSFSFLCQWATIIFMAQKWSATTPAEIDDDSFIVKNTVRRLTDEGVKSCSLKRLPIGTVLLSSRAPICEDSVVFKFTDYLEREVPLID